MVQALVLAMVLRLILCSSAVASHSTFSQDKGPRRTLARGAVAEMNAAAAAAPRSARPSSRGAEATPRRHLRGGSVVDDRRVLHTDDFAETVVDNQWLVLLAILLLMGSGSAWNYCLLLTCCETCQGRACPVPLTVRGTQALVSFAPLAFKLFFAARHNAVLRRSSFPSP